MVSNDINSRLTSAFSGIRPESIDIVCNKSDPHGSLFIDIAPPPTARGIQFSGIDTAPALSDDFIRTNRGFQQLEEKITHAGCRIGSIGGDRRYTLKLNITAN